MKLGLFCITLSFVFSGILLANISSIENNFTYYLFALNQDSTFNADQDSTYENTVSIFSENNIIKSPARAMLMSGLLPGMGQAYLGKWKRSIIYGVIEAVALGTWYTYNNDFSNEKRKYQKYANENWSFPLWLKDYYKWSNDENPYRDIFINESSGSYPHLWNESHHISFTWSHDDYSTFVRTSDPKFAEIYQLLCNNDGLEDRECSIDLNGIENNINEVYNIQIIRDHNFYENVGKYDPFFSGWVDNDEIYLYIKPSTGEKLAMSPNRRNYHDDYLKTEYYAEIAGYALAVILTNHVVSMVDALLTANLINKKQMLDVSVRPFYDYRNKWGVGGVNISFNL